MIKIDKRFRKEKLLAWEIKSLADKSFLFSFSNIGLKNIAFTMLILLLLAFITPFLPPRYAGSRHWKPPVSFDEYLFKLTNTLILIPLTLIFLFIMTTVKHKIDIRLGFKRIANFKITDVLDLGILKILILNNWRLFIIKRKEANFSSVKQGQIITIKRTGTFSLIYYYIRDEKTFHNEEQN